MQRVNDAAADASNAGACCNQTAADLLTLLHSSCVLDCVEPAKMPYNTAQETQLQATYPA